MSTGANSTLQAAGSRTSKRMERPARQLAGGALHPFSAAYTLGLPGTCHFRAISMICFFNHFDFLAKS